MIVVAATANLHTFVEAFRFIGDNPGFLLTKTWEQIELSGAALGIALLAALPLGVVLGHFRRGSGIAIAASIVGRGLPSLVLIAAFLTILGIGFVNNMVALAVLGSGPILTNAYDAVAGVDGDTVEAARGMRDQHIGSLPVASLGRESNQVTRAEGSVLLRDPRR